MSDTTTMRTTTIAESLEVEKWWLDTYQDALKQAKAECRQLVFTKVRAKLVSDLEVLKGAAIERQQFDSAADLRDIIELLKVK